MDHIVSECNNITFRYKEAVEKLQKNDDMAVELKRIKS
jgi:hypothetical protein